MPALFNYISSSQVKSAKNYWWRWGPAAVLLRQFRWQLSEICMKSDNSPLNRNVIWKLWGFLLENVLVLIFICFILFIYLFLLKIKLVRITSLTNACLVDKPQNKLLLIWLNLVWQVYTKTYFVLRIWAATHARKLLITIAVIYFGKQRTYLSKVHFQALSNKAIIKNCFYSANTKTRHS